MKQILLTTLLIFIPMLANAETVEIKGIWYNLVPKAKEAEVTWNPNAGHYSGFYSGSVEIPISVTHNDIEYIVTSIDEFAFEFCSGLKSISIPPSVKFIGEHAFWGCSGLTSVAINDIAAWCNIIFDGDSSNPLQCGHLYFDGKEITNLIIPTGVTSISSSAFSGCIGLKSVSIPNSVASIGSSAFYGCSGLNSVSIPPSVEIIGVQAFWGCSGLTSITVPNSVTSISNGVFAQCSGLTSVNIPNSVSSIGNSAFYGCSGLTSAVIPNSVESISGSAFENCSGLKSISIPNNVSSIGSWSFKNCRSLTTVNIGSSVVSIGELVFANCDELTDVYCFADQVPGTSPDAFQDSYPKYMTLHVPAASIEVYQSSAPWSQFKAIVPLDDVSRGDRYLGHSSRHTQVPVPATRFCNDSGPQQPGKRLLSVCL